MTNTAPTSSPFPKGTHVRIRGVVGLTFATDDDAVSLHESRAWVVSPRQYLWLRQLSADGMVADQIRSAYVDQIERVQ